MIGLMLMMFEVMFKCYLVTNFYDDPTPQNYWIMVLFANMYLFGYMWTVYLLALMGGSHLIKHKDQIWKLCEKLPLTTVDSVKKYISICQQSIQHPQTQRYLNIVRCYGRYVTTLIQYATVWCLDSIGIIDQTTPSLPLINELSSIIDVGDILKNIQIFKEIHNKVKLDVS